MFADAFEAICDDAALGIDYTHEGTIYRGVWSNAWAKVEGARGPAVSSKRPELMVQAKDITPVQDDTFTIDGVDYLAASVRADEEEVAFNVILKKAPVA